MKRHHLPLTIVLIWVFLAACGGDHGVDKVLSTPDDANSSTPADILQPEIDPTWPPKDGDLSVGPVFIEDPNAQVILDILVASPADTSKVAASAKIGHPIVVRFLSPEGTNYEAVLTEGVFGSPKSGLVPTPADLKARGIDYPIGP